MKRRNTNTPPVSDVYDVLKAREDNTLGRKIADARHAAGMSLPELSEALAAYGLSVGRKGLSKWETGETVPNAHQLLALCHLYRIDDPVVYFSEGRAVLNFEGMRKLAEYKTDLIASGRYVSREEAAEIEYIRMPVSLLPVSAGPGEFLDADTMEDIEFPRTEVPAGAEIGVRISGDSMEPVYHDGQIVWIQRRETVRAGEVGVFVLNGTGYLKMLRERPVRGRDGYDGQGAELVSYNKAYAPIPVRPDDSFRAVGRVLR